MLADPDFRRQACDAQDVISADVSLERSGAGFSLVVGDPQWLRYGLGGALFPILVGAALLVRHTIVRRTDERGLAAGA